MMGIVTVLNKFQIVAIRNMNGKDIKPYVYSVFIIITSNYINELG